MEHASGRPNTLARDTAALATPGAELSGMIGDGANGASVAMKPLYKYFEEGD